MFYARSNSVQRIPTRKIHITKRQLRQLFSKMADAGNIEVPECSSPTPTTARKFEISAWVIQDRSILPEKEMFRRFFEIFRNLYVIYRRFFQNFWTGIWAILRDICGKAEQSPIRTFSGIVPSWTSIGFHGNLNLLKLMKFLCSPWFISKYLHFNGSNLFTKFVPFWHMAHCH